MTICMLCIFVIIACVCDYLIYVICMLGGARSITEWGSMLSGVHYMFIVCMVCGILGNLLSFVLTVLWFKHFQVLPVSKGRVGLIALHPLKIYSALIVYYFPLMF